MPIVSFKFYSNYQDIMSRVTPGRGQSGTVKPKSLSWKERLTPGDYEQLENTFRIYDEDGSGTIDPEEIDKALTDLGLGERDPFLLELIMTLREKNKPIGMEEFIDIIASKVGDVKTKDGIQRIFGLYDPEGTGEITYDQMKIVAEKLGEHKMTDDDILEMMHSAFINRQTRSNESFNFEEFYLIVSTFWNEK